MGFFFFFYNCVVSTCVVVEFVTQDFLFRSVAASCICVHISVLMNIKQLMLCYDAYKIQKKAGGSQVSGLCKCIHGQDE